MGCYPNMVFVPGSNEEGAAQGNKGGWWLYFHTGWAGSMFERVGEVMSLVIQDMLDLSLGSIVVTFHPLNAD
jgi:hypothetical protein